VSLFCISKEFEVLDVAVAWGVVENLINMRAVAIKCGSNSLIGKPTLIATLPAEGISSQIAFEFFKKFLAPGASRNQ
jgi:hypothetical protein